MSGHRSKAYIIGAIVCVWACGICGAASGAEVTFADASLEQAVRDEIDLPTGPIDDGYLNTFYTFDGRGRGIADLSGIESWTGLMAADLGENSIGDLTPLGSLPLLIGLALDGNQISNVAPLAGLTSLMGLLLSGNQITDISALSSLVNLEVLHLGSNTIADLSPLAGLTLLSDTTLLDVFVEEFDMVDVNWVALDLSGNQITTIGTLSSLTALESLDISNNQLADLSPLSGLTALRELQAGSNQVASLSPLSGMSLTTLGLPNNLIVDVTALGTLSTLRDLDLGSNQIVNVAPLAALSSLPTLLLNDNLIVDISPLADAPGFSPHILLDLSGNPLNAASLCEGLGTLRDRCLYADIFPDCICQDGDIYRIRRNWLGYEGVNWPGGLLIASLGSLHEYATDYCITPTPMAMCSGSPSIVDVMNSVDRSSTLVGEIDGGLYAYSAPVWQGDDVYGDGVLSPGGMYSSADGLSWAPVSLPATMRGVLPLKVFGGGGSMFLQRYESDLFDVLSDFFGPVPLGSNWAGDISTLQAITNAVFMSSEYTVQRSTDGGSTWETVPTSWTAYERVGDAVTYDGDQYVRTLFDANNPTFTLGRAFSCSAAKSGFAEVDIVPGSAEHVAGLGEFKGELYALASGADYVLPDPPTFMQGFGEFDGGPTVWKTADGASWTAVSTNVPLPAQLLTSPEVMLAAAWSLSELFGQVDGLYYSRDGQNWFLWNSWPGGPWEHLRVALLGVESGYCYASVSDMHSMRPEMWQIPLAEFSAAGPPRVTVSRAELQDISTDTFPVIFDIVWSESVEGFDEADVILDGYTFELDGPFAMDGGLVRYTLTVTGFSMPGAKLDGVILPAIAAGSAFDGNGNGNEPSVAPNAAVTYTGDLPSPPVPASSPAGIICCAVALGLTALLLAYRKVITRP